jgi:hypothetical protein
MENNVTILSSHFCLNFQNCHALTEKGTFLLWSMYQKGITKPRGAHGGVMIHHIWTTQHHFDQPKKTTLHKPWSKLVWPILQKLYGVHNSETVRNIRSIQESPKSVTLSHLQLWSTYLFFLREWSTYQSPKVMAKSAWQSHRQTKQAVNRQLRSTEKTSHWKG